jgi:hypothetical protein
VDVEDVRGVGGGTFTNNDYDEYDDFMWSKYKKENK